MYDFIVHIVLVASLAAMIYLLARALPRVVDEEGTVAAGFFDRLVDKLPLQRIDYSISSGLEKMLRKAKILVLKLDNVINNYLEQIRKHSPAVKATQQVNLKEKMEAMQDDTKNNP
jgi:hypothetical protein